MQPIKTATQDNPSQSKHLIASLLRVQRDQGDLWPSLLAQETVDFYSSLSTPEKQVFLSILAQDFGLDSDGIKETARRVGEATDAVTGRSLKALSASMTAPYSLFLDRIYQLPDGLSFLVRMRQDLLVCFIPCVLCVRGGKVLKHGQKGPFKNDAWSPAPWPWGNSQE